MLPLLVRALSETACVRVCPGVSTALFQPGAKVATPTQPGRVCGRIFPATRSRAPFFRKAATLASFWNVNCVDCQITTCGAGQT